MVQFPFLGADVEALEKTELTGQFGLWMWVMVIGAAASLAGLVGTSITNHDAKVAATKIREAELHGEGLTRTLWRSTPRQLTQEQGFLESGRQGNLRIFSKTSDPPQQTPDAPPRLEMVITKNDRPVAIADVLMIDASASWALGSWEELTDGSNRVPLHSIFDSDRYRCQFEPLNANGIDVIFIGLESYPASDRIPNGELSDRRADALGKACLEYAKVDYKAGPTFWGVGLGRAMDETEAGTAKETRQRAAVMLVLSRRLTQDDALAIPEAFGAIIRSTNIDGLDLSKYTGSAEAGARLWSSSIDFRGVLPSGAQPRPDPSENPETAKAR